MSDSDRLGDSGISARDELSGRVLKRTDRCPAGGDEIPMSENLRHQLWEIRKAHVTPFDLPQNGE